MEHLFDLTHNTGHTHDAAYTYIKQALSRMKHDLVSLEHAKTPKYNQYSHYAFLFFLPFALNVLGWYSILVSTLVAIIMANVMTFGDRSGQVAFQTASTLHLDLLQNIMGIPYTRSEMASSSLSLPRKLKS